MDRSRSEALSDAHDDGAKYCTRCKADRAPGPSHCRRRGRRSETEPLPTPTQTWPAASTAGAAPPIHTAPCDSTRSAIDTEVGRRSAPAFWHPDHPTPVGGAVSVVATEPEDDAPRVQVQARSAAARRRDRPRGIHILVQLGGARGCAQSDQHMRRPAVDQLVGHHEELTPGRIDDRGPGDPDGGLDVPAGKDGGGTGVARWVDQTTPAGRPRTARRPCHARWRRTPGRQRPGARRRAGRRGPATSRPVARWPPGRRWRHPGARRIMVVDGPGRRVGGGRRTGPIRQPTGVRGTDSESTKTTSAERPIRLAPRLEPLTLARCPSSPEPGYRDRVGRFRPPTDLAVGPSRPTPWPPGDRPASCRHWRRRASHTTTAHRSGSEPRRCRPRCRAPPAPAGAGGS